MARFPEDLKYTREHEWIRSGNGNTVRVGITEHATTELGEVVYISLPTVGEEVAEGDVCGDVDSTKATSEIFSPLSGVVTAVNEALDETPEIINQDPYGDGWLFELEVADSVDDDHLLDSDAYAELVEE